MNEILIRTIDSQARTIEVLSGLLKEAQDEIKQLKNVKENVQYTTDTIIATTTTSDNKTGRLINHATEKQQQNTKERTTSLSNPSEHAKAKLADSALKMSPKRYIIQYPISSNSNDDKISFEDEDDISESESESERSGTQSAESNNNSNNTPDNVNVPSEKSEIFVHFVSRTADSQTEEFIRDSRNSIETFNPVQVVAPPRWLTPYDPTKKHGTLIVTVADHNQARYLVRNRVVINNQHVRAEHARSPSAVRGRGSSRLGRGRGRGRGR